MKIVLAGAGTAGHIEPALAVADAWKAKYPNTNFQFVGTPNGLENTLVPAAGYQLSFIPKVTLPRALNSDALLAPIRFFNALKSARKIVSDADCVIGFGGYVSAPIYLAAAITRTPFVIHEANSIPGWANKFGASLGGAMAVGKAIPTGKFKAAKVVGLPLKPAIAAAFAEAEKDWQKSRVAAKAKLGFTDAKPLLLVVGGSQGSVAINSVISQARADLVADFNILHSIGGKNELPDASDGYRPVSYIDDMATAYLAADLIIARSGAITCAEVNALGRYAVFIPLAIGNGEQARNADFLVSQDRAEVLKQSDFTVSWIQQNLARIMAKSSKLLQGNESDRAAVGNIVTLMSSHARIG